MAESRRAAGCSKREITSVANFMFVANFYSQNAQCADTAYASECLSECVSEYVRVYVSVHLIHAAKQARTVSPAAFALCGAVFTFSVIHLAANMF